MPARPTGEAPVDARADGVPAHDGERHGAARDGEPASVGHPASGAVGDGAARDGEPGADRRAVRTRPAWVRVAVATVVAVLLFAVVGFAAGPRWDPELVTTSVVPETASVAVDGSSAEATLGRYDTTSKLVDVELDGATTQVLVVEPVGLTEPAPAVVFLHGAGTGLAESFSAHAQALASAGVVAVSPSKRLDTYSTAQRDYVAMAADYERSVAYARTLPSVDPDRVGLYAESEGTWIAPVLADEDPDVAFVMLVSAPVVTPREQAAFAVDAYLRNVGVPAPLLRAIPRATGAHLPGGILAYADFDVLPYLTTMTQPTFMAYGTQDASMPTVQGPQIVAGALPEGADQLLVRYYAGANHGIRVGSSTDAVVPDFLAGVAAFALDPAGALAAGPTVAGATPVQVHLANAVPQPRWFADGEMLLRVPAISMTVLVGGYLLLLGAALVRTVARRRARASASTGAPRPPVRIPATLGRRAVGYSLAGLFVVVLLIAYVVVVAQLALNYRTNAAMVWGGWVVLQLSAVGAALLGVLAVRDLLRARRAWRAHRSAVRLAGERPPLVARGARGAVALLGVVGAWAVALGTTGLLVVAAYWGAFSPLS